MRAHHIVVALLAGLVASTALGDTVAIFNVNVVPMDSERVLEQQSVIVSDGVITDIGAVDATPVPEGAQVIDGTDRFLLPGLAEMHAHVPAASSPELDRYFSLFVANGVTTVRGMLGRPSHLQLRNELLAGRVFGPRLVTSGPSLNGNSVGSVAEARDSVRQQHAAGYDFLKIHPGLKSAEFEAIAELARELDMPFAGHVTVAVGVEAAMAAGMATIDHLDGYMVAMLPANFDASGGYGGWFDTLLAGQANPARIDELARKTADAGTWNVPTNILIEQLIDDTPEGELKSRDEFRYMPDATVQQWLEARRRVQSERGFTPEVAATAIRLRRQLILALHEADAGLLLGSDAPQLFNVPGFSLHRELQNLVDSGLTPYAALRAGTASVAEFLGTNTGVVARGREADLVMLNANPLEDIRNTQRVHGVMLRGQWMTAYELDKRIEPYRRDDD